MRALLLRLRCGAFDWHRWAPHKAQFGVERRCCDCGRTEVLVPDDGCWNDGIWQRVRSHHTNPAA